MKPAIRSNVSGAIQGCRLQAESRDGAEEQSPYRRTELNDKGSYYWQDIPVRRFPGGRFGPASCNRIVFSIGEEVGGSR